MASGEVVAFIDSDMVLDPIVIEDSVSLIAAGAVGVIVPEHSFGVGFWAAVRAYERSFYVGEDAVEAARVFFRPVVERVGGFDSEMTGGEDWDLTRRVRECGPIFRSRYWIEHDEGALTLVEACSKKAHYADGLTKYSARYGLGAVFQLCDRPYLRRPWVLIRPLGLGLIVLKGSELGSVMWEIGRRYAELASRTKSWRRIR